MLFLKILALICSTTLIWKIMYSPFDLFFRLVCVLCIVVAIRAFVLQ